MNILRPVLVRDGVMHSDKLCRMDPVIQLFFRNLLHACDGADRFNADVDDLRLDLYRKSLDRVKRHHVQKWLLACRDARVIELYTRSGKPFGRVLNYGQRDKKRKVIHPAPDDEAELPLLGGDDPPPKPKPLKKEVNRREERGREAPDLTLSDSEWLDGLAAAYPHIDVRDELVRCVKKKVHVDRAYFENHWLKPMGKPILLHAGTAAQTILETEPEAWRMYLKDKYENESWAESAAAYAWAEMPANWRAKIAREMKK